MGETDTGATEGVVRPKGVAPEHPATGRADIG